MDLRVMEIKRNSWIRSPKSQKLEPHDQLTQETILLEEEEFT